VGLIVFDVLFATADFPSCRRLNGDERVNHFLREVLADEIHLNFPELRRCHPETANGSPECPVNPVDGGVSEHRFNPLAERLRLLFADPVCFPAPHQVPAKSPGHPKLRIR